MTFARVLACAGLVFMLLAFVLDRIIDQAFPHLERLSAQFSAAYLAREIARLQAAPPRIVVLGDSVLWGYGLRADESAPARLRAAGYPITNFAYEGGSPANTYALVRLLLAQNVRPRAVLFNVNLKVFNPADGAYAQLAPGVETLVASRLTPGDRALLRLQPAPTIEQRIDQNVSHVWQFYALRPEIRETLFGDVDAVHALNRQLQRVSGTGARVAAAHRPTPDRFEGTYDLTPLDANNTSVHFLDAAVALLANAHVPTYALLTPTNHRLLHEYIDNAQYDENLRYLTQRLRNRNVHVIDCDKRFTAAQFLDNDHLTVAGNRQLARILRDALPR